MADILLSLTWCRFFDGLRGIVEVWERTTKQLVTKYTMSESDAYYQDSVSSVSWSPDSTRIASSHGKFIVWSPDGKYIASRHKVEIHDAMTGGFLADYEPTDKYKFSTQVWETRTGSSRIICEGKSPVESAAWSPDGNYIAAGHDDGIVRVWDIATDRVIPAETARRLSYPLHAPWIRPRCHHRAPRLWYRS